MCIGRCELCDKLPNPGFHYTFLHILAAITPREPPYTFQLHFWTQLVTNMTKTATVKKATKTAPASNCANPVLVPDNPQLRTPTQTGPDMAQMTPRHSEKTPGGSQPAAATKPRTQGDSMMSRTVPMASVQAPSPSSHCLQLSSWRNWARDPNPSRDDLTVTHPSPFKFMPQQTVTEASAAARSTLHLRTAEFQGGI